MGSRRQQRGVVLTVVTVTIIMLMALIAAVLSMAANQRRSMDQVGSHQIRAYYRAHAGTVDARWRIRNNVTADIGGGDFTDDDFDPPAYYIDLDADAVHTARTDADDVEVNISAVGAQRAGQRTVDAQGYQ